MATVKVELTGELAAYVRETVACGDYDSAEAVVEDGLARLRGESGSSYEARFDRLRREIDIGLAQARAGELVSETFDEIVAQVIAEEATKPTASFAFLSASRLRPGRILPVSSARAAEVLARDSET